MREIKFRAWDKVTEKWVSMMDLELHSWADNLYNSSGIRTAPNIDLMQFTGLKDKNGKDIYEGDTILVPDEAVMPITDEGQGPIEPCDHIVEVVFVKGEFGFFIPKTDDGETGWFTLRSWLEEISDDPYEVLGNSYEDANLLESK